MVNIVTWTWDDSKYPIGSKCASQKQSMKTYIVNHFKFFNKIFENNDNSMEIPEKNILKIKKV